MTSPIKALPSSVMCAKRSHKLSLIHIYLSKEESLKAFVIRTMGALGDVTFGQLLILVPSVFAGLLLAVLTIKPLNLLLFGEDVFKRQIYS